MAWGLFPTPPERAKGSASYGRNQGRRMATKNARTRRKGPGFLNGKFWPGCCSRTLPYRPRLCVKSLQLSPVVGVVHPPQYKSAWPCLADTEDRVHAEATIGAVQSNMIERCHLYTWSVLQREFLRLHSLPADRESHAQVFYNAQRFSQRFLFAPFARRRVPFSQRTDVPRLRLETANPRLPQAVGKKIDFVHLRFEH